MMALLFGLVRKSLKSLKGFLLHPAVLGLLIVLALSVAVWLLTPALPLFGGHPFASVGVRAALITVLFGIWAVVMLVRFLNSGETVPEAEKTSPDEETRQKQRLQVAERRKTMVTRFERQMDVLREHLPGRRSGRFAYHLPWYLLLGMPGAGKSTLLVRSSQDYPLAHLLGTDPLAPVTPTHDLPCWVTNEAVFIDTPGDLFSQDDASDDIEQERRWETLTGLLTRFRGRRPINGIVLVLSMETLLAQSEHERAGDAQAVRHRLLNLIDSLGTRFPIYVVFSKADMLAGFVEYFDDLRKHERTQTWGMTFDLPHGKDVRSAAWLDAFRHHHSLMTQRLNAGLLQRLDEERDPQRRALISGFPQRFGGIRSMVEDVLSRIFVVDRYTTPPLLRGVYFTSADQVGVPYDPLMGAVSLAFDVEPPPLAAHRSGPPYFTGRLLDEIVVPESGLAGDNKRVERRKAYMHRTAYAASVAVVAGCGYAWWSNYQTTRDTLQDTTSKLATYTDFITDGDLSLAAAAPGLDALRDVRERFTLEDRNPLLARITLASTRDLAPLSEDAYSAALSHDFLPRLAAQVEDALRNGLEGDSQRLLSLLRAYLMLTQPEHLEQEALRSRITSLWADLYPGGTALQNSLRRHLDAWMAEAETGVPLDDHLVARVRNVLSRIPRSERVYETLRADGLSQMVGGVDVSRNGGPLFHTVFRLRHDAAVQNEGSPATVPRLYTAEGWETFFRPRATSLSRAALSESWVVGDLGGGSLDDRQFRAFQKAIGEHYMRDYVAEWRAMLNTLEIVPFDTLPQTVQALEAMSGPASPVRAVLDLVARNTTLARPAPIIDAGATADGTAPGMKDVADTAKSLLTGQDAASLAVPPGHLDAIPTVEAFFAPMNDIMKVEGDASYYDTINTALADLYTFTRQIAESPDPNAAALSIARTRAAGQADDPITRLRLISNTAPAPVQAWLRTVADQTWRVILGAAEQQLNDQWALEVQRPWKNRLAGRYPIDLDATEDVALQDLAAFIGPEGVLETFYTANLAPFIDPRTNRPRLIDGVGMDLDPQALAQFRHAREIREALFSGNGATLETSFALEPVQLDPTVARAILDVDGQTIEYRHGPPSMARMRWPNPDGVARSELRFQEVGPYGRILRITAEGPWSWRRLLDNATVDDKGDHLRVTFTVSERQMAFNLWADGKRSLFDLPSLPLLTLPPEL